MERNSKGLLQHLNHVIDQTVFMESVPRKDAVKILARMTFEQFKEHFFDDQNDDGLEKNFDMPPGYWNSYTYWREINNYLYGFVEHNCEQMTVKYAYSKTCSKAKVKVGRLYSKNFSVQRLGVKIRNYLYQGSEYSDIDIANCHPSIMLFLFKHYHIHSPMLEEYVADRPAFLEKYKITKKQFLVLMNKDRIKAVEVGNNAELLNFFKGLVTCKKNLLMLCDWEDWDGLYKKKPVNKRSKHPVSAQIDLLLNLVENKLLQLMNSREKSTRSSYIFSSCSCFFSKPQSADLVKK
eukprot:Pgem_evm4s18915